MNITMKELEEEMPHILSVTYAQGKAIIIFEDDRCYHVKMLERECDFLKNKLLEDLPLRVKYRKKSEKYSDEPKTGRPLKNHPSKINVSKVIKMYEDGETCKKIAEVMNISKGSIGGVISALIANGEVSKRERIGKYDQLIIDNYGIRTITHLARELDVSVEGLHRRKQILLKKGLIK